jgi:hypothetical protein
MDIISKKKLKKKLLPKKRVKGLNVNSDKIIRIIKKFVIKCGIKKQKLKGGVKGIGSIFGFKNTDTSTQYGEDCFENLKNIDKIFEDIKDDILNAKEKIITDIELIIDEAKKNTQIQIMSKANEIKNNYEPVKVKIYSYKSITIEKDFLNYMDIKTYLLIEALDIVLALYHFREKMRMCAENQIAPNVMKDYEKTVINLYVIV